MGRSVRLGGGVGRTPAAQNHPVGWVRAVDGVGRSAQTQRPGGVSACGGVGASGECVGSVTTGGTDGTISVTHGSLPSAPKLRRLYPRVPDTRAIRTTGTADPSDPGANLSQSGIRSAGSGRSVPSVSTNVTVPGWAGRVV